MLSTDSLVEKTMGQKQSVTVRRWFDRHLHLRMGAMLYDVLPSTLKQQPTGAVIMGNLVPPHYTSTIERTLTYRAHILGTMDHLQVRNDIQHMNFDFTPKMTCYLTDEITPEEVVRGFQKGVWCAVKMYLAKPDGTGGTTNSDHGVKNLNGRYEVFEAMEKHCIPLLGHFEDPNDEIDEFDREASSIGRQLSPIRRRFPNLPIVVEHITDERMAEYVDTAGNGIYATVTPHHLIKNRNALFTGGLNPIHWCKPVLKQEKHRLALRKYVTSGNVKFGAGTDSAPHDIAAKQRHCGCNAGIFNARYAVELYTQVFDEENALENLGPFLSENFLGIYGIQPSSETMTIQRESQKISEMVSNVPVFMGKETINWTLVH